MSSNMSNLKPLGEVAPVSNLSRHARYVRLEAWSEFNGFREPTAAELRILEMVTGFDEPQILSFLDHYKLVAYAAYYRRIVDAPNEATRHVPGGHWLSMEPNADPIEQIRTEMETEMLAENLAHVEAELRKGVIRESPRLPPNFGPTSLFGILNGDRHYSIENGALHKTVKSLMPNDLEKGDPDSCLDPAPLSPRKSSTLLAPPASNNVSSSTQLAEPLTRIPDTRVVHSPTDGVLISELHSRTITAQTLLDLSSNPRLNVLKTKAPVRSYQVSQQQPTAPVTSSPRRSTYEEAINREEPLTIVSKRTAMHVKDSKVALTDAETTTFTPAQRRFILDNITAGPIGIVMQKDGSAVQVENETYMETEDIEDKVTVIEDRTAVSGDDEPKFPSTGGKYPSIRPVTAEPAKTFSQPQIQIEDSEVDLYSAEDSEEPIARVQERITTMSDVGNEISTRTEAIVTGPATVSTRNPVEAQYLGSLVSDLNTKGNVRASGQDDTVSATMDDIESEVSSLEAELVESSSPEQSPPAEEPEDSSTLSQSPTGILMSSQASTLSQSPIDVHMSSLASQLSHISMLESVVRADDVSDQMALEYTGGGIDDAVEIASRTGIVGAWQEVLDGGDSEMVEEGVFENWEDEEAEENIVDGLVG